jgi:MoaA/NifB/PqqE/SkfB family radical SAM enzyme
MTFYDNLFTLEIENSSICNAACPQCLRESQPGDHSWFNQTYLSTDFFKNNIPLTVYQNLKNILFIGTMGDPCAAPNFLEVCELITVLAPEARIQISSNGGLKNTIFWKKLGKLLKGRNHEVQFALDGLIDTNHIYRANVDWHKTMQNAEAFINAGGDASWQFIVFEHNQHQVDEAKKIAQDMGFRQFITRPSHRFFMDKMLGITRYGSNGIMLKPPTIKEYIHDIVFDSEYISIDDWLKKSETGCITCNAKKYNSAYIDVLGRLFPCCYLAASIHSRKGLNITINDTWDQLWKDNGDSKLNLHNNNWDNIINSKFYKEIVERWNKSYTNGRLAICSGICSKSDIQFVDPEDYENFNREYYP